MYMVLVVYTEGKCTRAIGMHILFTGILFDLPFNWENLCNCSLHLPLTDSQKVGSLMDPLAP